MPAKAQIFVKQPAHDSPRDFATTLEVSIGSLFLDDDTHAYAIDGHQERELAVASQKRPLASAEASPDKMHAHYSWFARSMGMETPRYSVAQ